jgi:hypothetical protein
MARLRDSGRLSRSTAALSGNPTRLLQPETVSLYGFAVFGYITASFASFFLGQEAGAKDGEVAAASDLAALRQEIALLREDLERTEPR